MVLNFVYSVVLLSIGCACAFLVLLFGMRFCKVNEKEKTKTTIKGCLCQILKAFPHWVWIVVFLIFQLFIIFALSVWCHIHEWIQNVSTFIGLLVAVVYVIVIKITDDDGKLKYFIKKNTRS